MSPAEPSPAFYPFTLSVRQIRLTVRLGFKSEERRTPQAVEVDLTFYFQTPLEAALSDHGDYICYDEVSGKIAAYCEGKEFRLIEFLGTEIYRVVRGLTPPEVKLKVSATKCNLPVPMILGGACYTHCDLPPGAWVVP